MNIFNFISENDNEIFQMFNHKYVFFASLHFPPLFKGKLRLYKNNVLPKYMYSYASIN